MAYSLRDRFVAGTSNLNPFAAPFLPESPSAGGTDRVSLTDSEASSDSEPPSPLPDDKGKRAVEPRRNRAGRRRRSPAATTGFMADARRQQPQLHSSV